MLCSKTSVRSTSHAAPLYKRLFRAQRNRMSRNVKKYLWSGVLFASLPLLAYGIHFLMLGQPADVDMLASWPYKFAWAGLLTGFFIVGLAISLLETFIVGLLAAFIADHFAPGHFTKTIGVLFVATIILGVILPAWPMMESVRAQKGRGYSIEDCRMIDPSINRGKDRDLCIRSVVSRMINEKDPALDEAFCNSILRDDKDDQTGSQCWQSLAFQKGTSADFCDTVPNVRAKNTCYSAMARKLQDAAICDRLEEGSGGTPASCRQAMNW